MTDHGMIGKSIRELRKKRAMTQGRLADRVGVTTQAVSKWECGSTPDAELLPAIASALGVSIDTLFGLSDEVKKDPVQSVAHAVSQTGEGERMDLAVRCAMAAAVATAGSASLNELIPLLTGGVERWKGSEHLMRLLGKAGFAIGNLTEGKQYVLLACAPEDGYDPWIGSVEDIRQLLLLLGREDALKILLFLLHRHSETAVLSEVIARETHLSREDTERCLEELAARRLVNRCTVEGERGALSAWNLLTGLWLLALLMLLSDLGGGHTMMLNLEMTGPEDGGVLKK